MTMYTDERRRSEAGIWQEVEFGSYDADIPLWKELAQAADGPVLELGAGAGRVTFEICGRYSTEGGWNGVEVLAVEHDPDLVADLKPEAQRLGLVVRFIEADLEAPETLAVPVKPALAIGPLHVIQMIHPGARRSLLVRLAELCAPDATIALTIVDESTLLSSGAGATQILPDMREFDGWVYSSEPLWVQVGDDALRVRRIRERVSPEGHMEREIHDELLHRVSAEELEEEALAAGIRPAGRRQIRSGPDEADSTVVLLEGPG